MDQLPTDLKSLLTLGMGVGAARVSIWLMNRVKRAAWTNDTCEYMSLGIASVLGIACYGVGIAMLWNPLPGDWRAWVNTLVSVGIATGGAAKLWYDKLPGGGHA
jgi:hypothetical protein